MWIEELPNGKFKFNERYIDVLTEKTRYVSVTLKSKSNQARKQAQSILDEKIDAKKNKRKQSDMTFEQLYEKWLPIYQQNVKRQTYTNAVSAYKVVSEWFDRSLFTKSSTRGAGAFPTQIPRLIEVVKARRFRGG